MNTSPDAQPVRAASPLPAGSWHVMSAGLLAAAVLLLATGAATAWSYTGVSTRLRLEALSATGANALTATFVLAAVLALIQATRVDANPGRLRPVFVVAFVVAVIIVLLVAFAVWDAATVHRETLGVGSSFSRGSGTWKARTAGITFALSSGVLAALAMVLANRHAPRPGARDVEQLSGEPS